LIIIVVVVIVVVVVVVAAVAVAVAVFFVAVFFVVVFVVVVIINRGIFQGDLLLPFVFIIVMTPLTMLLRKEVLSYPFGEDG